MPEPGEHLQVPVRVDAVRELILSSIDALLIAAATKQVEQLLLGNLHAGHLHLK